MGCCSQYLTEQSRQYVREMTEVLATLDLGRLKDFYRKWAKPMELPPLPEDARLEEDMYLMILELPGLEHLHESSRQWLADRGLVVEIRETSCRKHSREGDYGPDGCSSADDCCRGR